MHRHQIAKQALKSYRKVFGGQVSMGMVTGNRQDYDADIVFATVQTLSKEETLQRYQKDTWDLIIIDEAHHSSAGSYKKIMDYFTPKLWLGMTATPDKRDDNLEGKIFVKFLTTRLHTRFVCRMPWKRTCSARSTTSELPT